MWNWLKKIRNRFSGACSAPEKSEKESDNMLKMKRFTIKVFFYDASGRQAQRIEKDVKAFSRQELISLYASCGEKIQIIDEFDDGPVSSGVTMQQVVEMTKANNPDHVDNTVKVKPKVDKVNVIDADPSEPKLPRRSGFCRVEGSEDFPQPKIVVAPPRYFTIGGVEIKDEGGKLYQKQWIRISPKEEGNYRVVSDSTNKIVSLTGKHIEKRIWVQVEDESKDAEEEYAEPVQRKPKPVRPKQKKPKVEKQQLLEEKNETVETAEAPAETTQTEQETNG